MQEKMQKFSPIKQRILQYIDTKGISMREFYTKSGISRGTLESSSGITEETISKLLNIYPNISPVWLLKGIGVQEISQVNYSGNTNSGSVVNEQPVLYGSQKCQQCDLRERLLQAKDQTIISLQALVDEMRKKCP